jgi:glycosyltransferase involved in cell wall biosynthesis
MSAPLRILWLTETHPPSRGGMACSSDRIVEGLRTAGVTVDVFHLGAPGLDVVVEHKRGGCLVRVPAGDDPGHCLHRAWLAARGLGHPWTHVLAFGGDGPLLAGPVFAAFLQAPLVVLFRGNDLDVALFAPRRMDTVRRAIEAAAAVCVLTRDHAWKLQRLFPAAPVHRIPNGIDLESFSPLATETARAQQWRAQTVAPGRRTIGVVGQLKAKKGVALLLQALCVSGVAERLHLHLVGDADPALTALLAELPPTATVTHQPFVDRLGLLSVYPAFDLVCVPSFYDGMPNVLLEAMALGIPVLGANAGGMPDVIEPGTSGLLFDVGDVAGCATALRSAVDLDDEARAALGKAAHARIAAAFTGAQEIEGYRSLLAQTARGSTPAAAPVPPLWRVG